MWTIYKILSPSGKIYVGSSKNFKKRMQRYKYYDCEKQPRLYRSLLKYGFNNHKIEVLELCQESDAYKKERYFGDLFNVLGEYGLNVSLPGYNDVPRVFSDEFKKNVSKRVSGSGNPMFGKSAFVGRNHTNETKELCRVSKLGSLNAMFGKSSFDSPGHIICLHKEYGIFTTLKEASFICGYSIQYMSQMLSNFKPNKTPFISCKN